MKDEPTKEADFGGASSLTYTVLMGGDKVAKTNVGTITYAYTPDVTKYTIVFKAEDGTQISSTEYEEGATVTLPTDPTKAEDENYTYTFAGWKVEGADDNTATKSITATANATYVPVFTATPKGTETPEYMPLPIMLAHKLANRLADLRKLEGHNELRPDGKTQVSVEYDENNNPVRIDTIVVSTQHNEEVTQEYLRD